MSSKKLVAISMILVTLALAGCAGKHTFGHSVEIDGRDYFVWGRPDNKTPTPTLEDGDSIDFADYILELPPWDIVCSPGRDDTLTIDWSNTMTITDALSQTIVIQGPATVRFGEGASR